jgi:hypothetical protein
LTKEAALAAASSIFGLLFPHFALRILPPANRGVTCVTHAGLRGPRIKIDFAIAKAETRD